MGVPANQSAQSDVGREVLRIVARFRRRSGFELLLRWMLRLLSTAMVVVGLLYLVAWLAGIVVPLEAFVAAPALALSGAFVVSLLSWPSPRQAALRADRLLRLDERLSTAVELLELKGPSRFTAAQVRNAELSAQLRNAEWPSFGRVLRRDLLNFGAVSAFAIAAVLFVTLSERFAIPRPTVAALLPLLSNGTIPLLPSAEAPELERANAAVEPPPPRQERSSDDLKRMLGASDDDADARLAKSRAELNQRAQQSLRAGEAMDRLAEALDDVSPGQAASESIERGDFDRAGAELADLGDEADQLSPAAKQELAESLSEAADETEASNPALAQREREAAEALRNGDSGAQRAAMQALGEEVVRSGESIDAQGDLAEEMDQIQQEGGVAQAPGQESIEGERETIGGDPASNGDGEGDGAGSVPGQADGQGQSSGGQAGDQPGDAPGEGAVNGEGGQREGETPASGAPSRLDVDGRQVEVPVKAADGPSSESPTEPGEGDTVREGGTSGGAGGSAESQEPEVVAPEQNAVPNDRRQVVKEYFSGDETE